jgi:hypothetical protein
MDTVIGVFCKRSSIYWLADKDIRIRAIRWNWISNAIQNNPGHLRMATSH